MARNGVRDQPPAYFSAPGVGAPSRAKPGSAMGNKGGDPYAALYARDAQMRSTLARFRGGAPTAATATAGRTSGS